jgi:hypothetical protein
MVARDGIEPPTPAFSGLDSFRAIILITKAESRLNVPKTAHLLGQEWDKILAGQNCLSHCCPIPFLEFRHVVGIDPSRRERPIGQAGGRQTPPIFSHTLAKRYDVERGTDDDYTGTPTRS